MRSPLATLVLSAGFVGSLGLAACSSRTLDVEADYRAEVEQICTDLCEKVVTCVEPPLFETQQECRAVCMDMEMMYEDSVCGEAFREYRKCTGGTSTCTEYLDTHNVHADDYLCKAQSDVIVALACGASEASD